jgi:hypothetical protein
MLCDCGDLLLVKVIIPSGENLRIKFTFKILSMGD